MERTTKRRFTDEFKREAVALWETSGRTQTEIAHELGIVPTMLRRWQRGLKGDGAPIPGRPPSSVMVWQTAANWAKRSRVLPRRWATASSTR